MRREGRDADGRLDILRRCSLLDVLDGEVLVDLARQGRKASFERRATLHAQGDRGRHVYVIGSGRVRLLRSPKDDRDLTIAYRGPGSIVGEDALHGGVFHTEARAAERTEGVLLGLPALRSAVESEPKLGLALLEEVLASRQRCERRMEALLSKPVEARVADFLCEAVATHGIVDSRGHLVAVKYTHLEIANYVGSTRETVTLVLGDLKRRGIIEIDRRRVVVTKLDLLRALA